jgi:predicted metalloprotease with PDZ domain
VIARLAEGFVCVRVQSMNGVDLGRFPFDYDLTWMAFFTDAAGRVYARYGGRDDDGPETYLSQASLAGLMREVLRLHERHAVQGSRYEPAADAPPRRPEDLPAMAEHLAPRKPPRCIHCHDVKMAELKHRRQLGTLRKADVFGYPTPTAVGLRVDRDDQRLVRDVRADSPAAAAGLRGGDRLVSLDGQRLLSVADLARVLELTPDEAELPLTYERGGEVLRTTLRLGGPWRRSPDPSWRASINVVGPNGGFWGVPLGPEERAKLGLPADRLALRVTTFFNNQAAPVQAGLKVGDVIVEFDGRRQPMTALQLHAHLQMNRDYGDRVPLAVLRGGKEVTLTLELPARPR